MRRPFVRLNMASSIDGKITTRTREAFSLGSSEDRALMEHLRAEADAVLIGRGTLVDEDPQLVIGGEEGLARRRALIGTDQPTGIVASASLDFRAGDYRFFTARAAPRVVFTTERADTAHREEAALYARVVTVPADAGGRLDVGAMLAAMPDLGIERLLLEGGGGLNFAMLEADLVDEIHLTLCPLVIGGVEAPTAFEGEGFLRATMRRLQLVSLRVNEAGEIYLKYRLAAAPV